MSDHIHTKYSVIKFLSLLSPSPDLGHRDQETGAGAAYPEPLGQSPGGVGKEPVLWLLPGHQGEVGWLSPNTG